MTTVRLKRWEFVSDDLKPTIPGPDNTLSVECVVVTPPSMAGRRIYLYLDQYDVTDLLKELRDSARHARQTKTPPSPTHGTPA